MLHRRDRRFRARRAAGARRAAHMTDGDLKLAIAFDAENEWPDIVPPGFDGPIQYTVCAFLNIGGDWIGSAFIQMWRGRDGVGDAPSDFARNWWYSSRWGEMAGHQLAPGEA